VPVGIKDLVATKGIRTVMGSVLYKDFVPDEDDIIVERLKAAGAVIIGKTNVPELGYSGVGHSPVFETTRNPWNLALTTGGSSAGSGASVAAGVAPFAIGSDGGGSVRIPAAHCGLYGIKASMGRVPLYPGCRDDRYPGVSSWETLEHIGPLSRTVTDSALMLSVITGPDPRDRYSIPAADFDYVDAVRGDIRGCASPIARTGATQRSIPRCGASSAPRPRYSRASSAARSSARTPAGVPTSARPSRH
jgi:aspartyl-tRNA(Asn)/glutamyl-tRNA(Gln) amidotransferase subunit A